MKLQWQVTCRASAWATARPPKSSWHIFANGVMPYPPLEIVAFGLDSPRHFGDATSSLSINHIWNSPEFRSTVGLDFLLLLELDGRQHPVPDVFAFRVVEHFNVVEHVLASFIA